MSSSFPITHIEIEFNHDCNRACWYCPNAQHERVNKGQMNESTFDLLVRRLEDVGYEGNLSYQFYNEPLLFPHLEKFVDQLTKSLPKTTSTLYTNGTLLTLERFKALRLAGIKQFIVTRHEAERDYLFEKVYPLLTDEEKALTKFQTHKDIHYTNRGGLVDVGSRESAQLLPCHIPTFLMVITHQGKILGCFEDFNEELGVGDLRTQSLSEIWESKPYIELREKLKKGFRHQFGPCSKCNRVEVLGLIQGKVMVHE